jgi:hypothetical protein
MQKSLSYKISDELIIFFSEILQEKEAQNGSPYSKESYQIAPKLKEDRTLRVLCSVVP